MLGVLAHEISHVRNRDILISSVAAAVAMGITFLARMAMWGAMFGGGRSRDDNVLGTLALAILAPVAAAQFRPQPHEAVGLLRFAVLRRHPHVVVEDHHAADR